MSQGMPAGRGTPAAGRPSRPSSKRPAWARLAVAIGLLALGLFFAVEAVGIRVLPTYARVGPRFFPYLVAGGLILLGAALTWRAWRGLDSDVDPTGEAPADKLPMLVVVGGLVLQSLIFGYVGFVIAATMTFVLTCAGFGSRHLVRDGAIGLALAVASYVGFTRGLGLHLPAGFLEGLL
jgi:hypothetical protein